MNMKILVIGRSGLIGMNLIDGLRQKGHEAAAAARNLGIWAALFAAVCISVAPAHHAADSKSRGTLVCHDALPNVPVYEIDQQALAPLRINRPATALSLSRRAEQVQTGAAQPPQHARNVRAFLRAIQTIFHLARTAYLAMAARLSLSGRQWLRALASRSLANRAGLTVSASGA